MFTGGVGALIDLPNFPVLVRGLDDWRYDTVPGLGAADRAPAAGRRRQAARRPGQAAAAAALAGRKLRRRPHRAGVPGRRAGHAVPAVAALHRVQPAGAAGLRVHWGFVNDKARRPDEAKFFHQDCPRTQEAAARGRRAVRARLRQRAPGRLPLPRVRAPGRGLPRGQPPGAADGRLRRQPGRQRHDPVHPSCPAKRNISQAMGRRGEESLPTAGAVTRTWAPSSNCDAKPMVIVVGASNTWFAQTLSALAVPATGASELQAKVEQLWEHLQNVTRPRDPRRASGRCPSSRSCTSGARTRSSTPSSSTARRLEAGAGDQAAGVPRPAHAGMGDLHRHAAARADRRLHAPPRPGGVPAPLAGFLSDVVQAERLREVRALTGFTRLDAPDPRGPRPGRRARRWRGTGRPGCPRARSAARASSCASTTPLLAAWEARVARLRRGPRAQGGIRAVPHQPVLRPASRPTSIPMHGWPGRPVHRPAHPVAPADPDDRAGMRLQLGEPVRADLLRTRTGPASSSTPPCPTPKAPSAAWCRSPSPSR